ncbi:amidase domain-containing protein [Agromyces sp. Root1464]|uniref:amidase domain-containing protein n=1 Tax=Agromyces sp. Root1464 TaxID=1736467 RepID=UPI0009EC8AAF|nr:amidase domain-containing protein [Agromyces sp. Root1464]
MSPSEQSPVSRRRGVLALAAVAGVVLVAGGAAVAWSAVQQGDGTASNGVSDTVSGASGAGREASDVESGVADFSAYSDGVAAQLAYAFEHWDDTESDTFGYLDDNDCVNFTSQSLLARGWAEDDEWWYDESGDAYGHADAWISSTAMRDYLEEHPERATALTDDERASVKVGDVVQFDWDDSGDRDHTGIVTSVETEPDGSITILYAGHTDPTWDRSVDWAITELHPGGVAYYWSIPE